MADEYELEKEVIGGRSEMLPSTRRVTTQERLRRRKKDLIDQLQEVDEAIKLFEQYPYLAQAVDLLGKIGI